MKKSITQKIGLLGKPLLILLFTALFWPTTVSATHCIDTLDFEFSIDNNSKTVKFESIVSSDALALKWDFGDGNSGSGQNVVHTYSTPGIYQVILITMDPVTNCTFTRTKDIHLQGTGPCDPMFSIVPDPNNNMKFHLGFDAPFYLQVTLPVVDM